MNKTGTTHTPNTPAGGLTATEIEILRDKIRLGKSVLPSEVHKLCDMALQSLTRTMAGEEEIEAAVGKELLRIKPSRQAQEARSRAYLVEWDDFGMPDYVVSMMDITAQQALNAFPSLQRAEDIQEEMRQLANKLLAEVKACLELNKAKGLDNENAVQQIIWFFNYVLKSYSSDRLTQPPSGKMRSSLEWGDELVLIDMMKGDACGKLIRLIKAIQADALASRSQDAERVRDEALKLLELVNQCKIIQEGIRMTPDLTGAIGYFLKNNKRQNTG